MTKPASDESRDYRYRIGLDKKDWIKLAARLAEAVDYSNFKSAVHDQPSQSNKSMAYLRIWQTMMDVQRADRDAEDDDRLGHDDDSIPCKSPTTIDEPDKPAKQPAKRKTAAKKVKKLW